MTTVSVLTTHECDKVVECVMAILRIFGWSVLMVRGLLMGWRLLLRCVMMYMWCVVARWLKG